MKRKRAFIIGINLINRLLLKNKFAPARAGCSKSLPGGLTLV
jgi:hypothetical protein